METLAFQAEVKELLQLMIHSLYSNKEIFLRELISNASDAADKLRFEAISNPKLYEDDAKLCIQISIDKVTRTITISDNGIGMSCEEMVSHLGTIAKSGTKDFFQKLSGDQKKDATLIGQFGVGFYSAFIVASRVTVESRKAGELSSQASRWQSDGLGKFTIETIEQAKRGTHIKLELREGEDDFLSISRIKLILRKYSDHISIPILLPKEEWNQDKQEMVIDESELETVNQATALWHRNKSDISNEEYIAFYGHVAHDHSYDSHPPLAWAHNRVEGRSEYTQLLYIPSKAPPNLWDRSNYQGLKLYIKRIFIMDNAEQLLPAYLRFIRGLIDSSDLPLNVSREILQESRDSKLLKEGCAKRILTMLEELAANNPEKYNTFWQEFGQVFKEGIGEDFANQERIIKLVRFASTNAPIGVQTVDIAGYCSRMQEGQNKIYYLTASTDQSARNSPHLEIFKTKGIEVLLLSDRVDEWMVSFLPPFENKEWVSVAKGGLDLEAELNGVKDEEQKAKQEKTAQDIGPFIASIKTSLTAKVKDVRITFRLTDSPSCLVADQGDMSGYLQRLLKQSGHAAPQNLPILEINPDHKLIKSLQHKCTDGFDENDINEWANILFDQALLAEGALPENPALFVKRINNQIIR